MAVVIILAAAYNSKLTTLTNRKKGDRCELETLFSNSNV
mgnify:FL=1